MALIPTKRDQQLCVLAARAVCADEEPIEILSFPDEQERNDKAVDALIATPEGVLALEHTLIESFPNQVTDDVRIEKLFPGYRLDASLPPGRSYSLIVRIGVADGHTRAEAVRDQVRQWVGREAQALEPLAPGGHIRHSVTAGPPELPIDVTLRRHPDGLEPRSDTSVAVSRAMPEDLEQMRATSARRALDGKVPKLIAAPAEQTVLVVESRSLALDNSIVIENALRTAHTAGSSLPDVVVLISTTAEYPFAWVLFEEEIWATETDRKPKTFPEVELLPVKR